VRPSLAIGRFTTTEGNHLDPILQKQAVGQIRLNARVYCICAGSSVRKSGPHLTPGSSAERAARDERLAKALRENLRRRKEQRQAQERQGAAQPKGPDREREPPA
jgi:hypothetical protein